METFDWAKLPGTLLPGGYEVEQCLSAGEKSATFKIRILGDRFTSARGEFFNQNTIPAAQVDIWLAASSLRHPNVSRPLTAGLLEQEGSAVRYFVEEQPEETLDKAIAERPLSIEEAREVARAVSEGLSCLHANGFAQFQLCPASVAAIGDRICVRLDSVRQTNTPIAPGEDPSMPGDVRLLGETIHAVLTQNAELVPESIAALPRPFNFIVDRCLDPDLQKRCSLDDVRAMLRGQNLPAVAPIVKPDPAPIPQTPAKEPPAAKVSPIPIAEKVLPAKPVPEPAALTERPKEVPSQGISAKQEVSVKPVPAYIAEAVPAPQRILREPETFPWSTRRPPDEEEKPRREPRAPIWFYLPIAALLIAALLLWVMRPSHKAQPTATKTAWPSREVGPATTAPTPRSQPQAKTIPPAQKPAPALPRSSNQKGDIWRVVSFTFNRQGDAEKRAKAINGEHPALQAEVFSPSGGAPYLVVLGGAMSREQAEELRRKARSSGLPHDTYIQNYSR